MEVVIVVLLIFVAVPPVAYMAAKFGVAGYLRGKELFDEKHNKKRRPKP